MGTGLGPESYAIIEQGRIGQILSNKPADRRAVIEEAAGITKFRTRKRLAEARLEGAKQNLSRVFDILEEVGRQCNSLKRQASKARRYEELRTEMVAHLKVALTGRYRMLEREAAKLALDLNQAARQYQELAQEVQTKDADQTRLLEQSYATETELTENRKTLSEHQVEAERTRGRLDSQARQIAGIEQRLAQSETETQDIDGRRQRAAGELEVHTANLASLDQQTEAARQALTLKNQERDNLQNALRDRERSMESARQQVIRLLGEASSLKNQLAQVEEYLASIERDRARSEREVEQAGADLTRLEQVKKDLGERMSQRQLELESIGGQRRNVEQELASQRTRLVDARKNLDQTRSELSHQRARRDSLEEVIQHRSYTTESVKRLFTAIERGDAGGFKPAGVLADFVEVLDARFEKATEEFLHDELEYVVVKDWTQAERGIDVMRSDLDGRATFLVEPEGETTAVAAPVDAPSGEGVISPLRDVLRLTNGLTHAPAALSRAWPGAIWPRTGHRHSAWLRGTPICFFLSPDGVSYHGHAVSGGSKSGAGPLALKRELREIAAQVAKRERDVQQTQAVLEGIEGEIARLTEELERLRGVQQAQEKDALALDHELRKLKEEHQRASQRLSVAGMELERLRKENARSLEQKDRNIALIAEKETLRTTQEQVLEDTRTQLTELQQQAQTVTEEHSALRADLASFEERRRAEQSSKARLENQIRELSQRRQFLSDEMERLGVERARLLQDNIGLDARASELAAANRGAREGGGRTRRARGCRSRGAHRIGRDAEDAPHRRPKRRRSGERSSSSSW